MSGALKSYSCGVCDIGFIDKKHYIAHLSTHASSTNNSTEGTQQHQITAGDSNKELDSQITVSIIVEFVYLFLYVL